MTLLLALGASLCFDAIPSSEEEEGARCWHLMGLSLLW